jgi:hypothetical protein
LNLKDLVLSASSSALQVCTQPFQTFVQTVTRGGTCSLDVPWTLTNGVQSELVSDLSSVHSVWQILLVGEHQEKGITQDLPNAMNAAEITEKLGLHSIRQRPWYIQATCATTGDGLYEGLEWLKDTLNKGS